MSSVTTFDKVLMCPPHYFSVDYEINPWMHMSDKVDVAKAQSEWDALKTAIESCGVQARQLTPIQGLPDMVFVCNAGLVYGNKVYLAYFRHAERRGERPYYKKYFEDNGYDVVGDTKHFFEGGGDAVFSSSTKLWAGVGPRSDRQVYGKVQQQLGSFQTIICDLIGEPFYHMDTCFAPLSERLGLWYPGAFTKETQRTMSEQMELVDVGYDEAQRFACNAMGIGGHSVILPTGCPKTAALLRERRLNVLECAMGEFNKSGGACQCLVMKL